MTLESGHRLGKFEVLDLIGRGATGEVYRARDTELGREVAIKVIARHLADDPAHMQRFEREARALAALNHPGIATIYGFEEHEGRRFIVMELVPGETLKARISASPI